jgi:hypothetical protein
MKTGTRETGYGSLAETNIPDPHQNEIALGKLVLFYFEGMRKRVGIYETWYQIRITPIEILSF